MLDVVLRRPEPADLAAARELCAAVLDRDDEPAEIADLLLGCAGGTHRLALAAYDGSEQLVGVAAGGLRTRTDGRITAHLNLVAVRPEHQRTGVGRTLVTHVERWSAGRGAGEMWWGNDAPTYAWPGVDRGYGAAHALAAAMGYTAEREATNLTVDLDTADLATEPDVRRLAAEGVLVERMKHVDQSDFLAWVRSFGGTWAAEAVQTLTHQPIGCHVARRDGQWVGFACHGVNRRGWFGPMGTAASERGRGVGAVLLRRCLADQRAAGLRTAQIGWVGPVSFYGHTVGAFVDREFTLYRKEFANPQAAPTAAS